MNPKHEVGKHKARVFQSALGLSLADAEWLREQILLAAQEKEATEGALLAFGQTYILDFNLARGVRAAVVRTTWIVEHGTDFPRLTSCYIK